jgi:hypothetical protein
MTLSHVVECRAGDSALRKGGGVDIVRSTDDVKADHLGALHHDRDGQEKPRTEIARFGSRKQPSTMALADPN